MAIAAPGFGLAVLGLGPPTLHWWGYLLLWAACSGLVAALMYRTLSRTGLGYASRYSHTAQHMHCTFCSFPGFWQYCSLVPTARANVERVSVRTCWKSFLCNVTPWKEAL